MKTLKINLVSLFGILLLFSGCNNNPKIQKVTQKEIVKYNNGNIFCEGFRFVNKESGKLLKQVGIWKFYNPNGTLSSYEQYDKDGKLINLRQYNIEGVLEISGVYTKNTENEFYYFEDGKIQTEWVTRIENEDGEETTYLTHKTYYKNSQMAQQQSYIDGDLDGITNAWDENGNLALSVEYKKGIIITEKK